jgi:hypothetical protein
MDYQQIENQQQQEIGKGQQAYQSDVAAQQQYKNQFDTSTQAATAAQGKVADYANYLQNAGSGSNVYAQQLQAAQQTASYDPAKMAAAQQDALRQSAAMNALSQQQNTPGQFYMPGLSAAQGAAQEQAQLAPIQLGVQNANTVLGQQNTSLQNALSQAQTGTGAQLKTQEDVQAQLQNSFSDAQDQAKLAQQAMDSYAKLANLQNGLNASQLQGFYAARQAYATAQQAMAQAAYTAAQTQQQQMQNAQTQAYMGSNAYQNYLKYGDTKGPGTTTTTTTGGGGGGGGGGQQKSGGGIDVLSYLNPVTDFRRAQNLAKRILK